MTATNKTNNTNTVLPATLRKFFMGGNFFLSMYIITKNPYVWQGKVDGLIIVHVFFLQNVMPAVSDVVFFLSWSDVASLVFSFFKDSNLS